MNSRRNFLKTSLIGGALAAIGDWGIPQTAMPGMIKSSLIHEPQWCTTIFCQFDHPVLQNTIEAYAREAGCQVIFGEDGSPDIFAMPAFIQIIDRNSVGADMWQDYVAFSDDVHDDTPCILVDVAETLAMPKTKYVVRFELVQPDDINDILDIVKNIQATVPFRKMLQWNENQTLLKESYASQK